MHHERSSDQSSHNPTTVDWTAPNSAIIVPLDGSIEAKAALPMARLISRITGAAVRVLHVAEAADEPQQVLQHINLSVDETPGLVIDQEVGPPGATIVRVAEERKASLIAMSTRGKTAYQGRTLRPVPEQVLAAAHCPVLLVRPEIAARVSQMHALRRVLLPLDGSPSAMSVVGPAVSLATRSGAEVDMLYVAQVHMRVAGMEPGTLNAPRYVDQPQYEWPGWIQEYADRFCSYLGENCPVDVGSHVFMRHGVPQDEIVNFASERSVDLIVLEWKGRLDRAHANVVSGVLENSPSPVLLLRTVPES